MKLRSNGQNTAEQRAMAELLEGSKVIRQTAFCLASEIVNVAEHIITALQQGYKVMTCGNGGSAADAQHFAAELVGRYRRQRPSWAAIALTVDSSVLTSLSNDYGFEQIFAVAISTSGTSKNVLAAVEMASALGIRTVGLTGEGKSRLGEMVDHHLPVPSTNTAFIQQAHIAVLHVFCELVEERLTGETMNTPDESLNL
jgi:D-sedoheptulose 7-phosphate isomerase